MSYKFLNQVSADDEPVILAEAKEWLKREADDTLEDTLIQNLISAARAYAEKYTGLLLVERQIVYTYQGKSSSFILPFGPGQTITEIKQTLRGIDTILAEGVDYSTDGMGYYELSTQPMWRLSVGRIYPRYQVTYTAGYNKDTDPTTARPIDPDIKLALLQIIGETYSRRTHSLSGTIIAEVPIGAKELLKRHVVNAWSII